MAAALLSLPFGLVLVVDGVRLVQHVERFGELVVTDLPAVDVQPGEEGFVQGALDLLVALAVQGTGIIQEIKGGGEDLSAGVELADSLVKLPGDLLPFITDTVNFLAELGLRPAFFGS